MIRSRALLLFSLAAACSATPHPAVEHATSAPLVPSTTTAPPPPPAVLSPVATGAPEVTSELDKTLYALGLILGRNLDAFDLSPRELALVQRGLADQAAGALALVRLDDYGPKVNELRKQRLDAQLAAEGQRSAALLAREAAEPGAVRLPSGVVYRSLVAGGGRSPKASDRVEVNYTGTLADGREFDSNATRGGPAVFALGGVIACWTEGLQKMKIGERAILVCPAALAYGDKGRPPTIRGGAALRYDVELVGILDGK